MYSLTDASIIVDDHDLMKMILTELKEQIKAATKHQKSFPGFYKFRNFSSNAKWMDEVRRYVPLVRAHVMAHLHGTAPPRAVRDLLMVFRNDFDKFIVELERLVKSGKLLDKLPPGEADEALYNIGDDI